MTLAEIDTMGTTEKAVGNETTIKLGLVLTIVCSVIFGVWKDGQWRGDVGAKLESIQVSVQTILANQAKAVTEIEDLRRRVTGLEASGTPLAIELRKRLEAVETDMKVHLSQGAPKAAAKP